MKTSRTLPRAVPAKPERRAVQQVQVPSVVVPVPSVGLQVEAQWTSRYGDLLITSDQPFAVVPVADNAIRIVRQR